YLACTFSERCGDVSPRANVVAAGRRSGSGCLRRRESVSPRDRVLSERFRRTACECALPAAFLADAGAGARTLEARAGLRLDLRGDLALECSGRGNRHVLGCSDRALRIVPAPFDQTARDGCSRRRCWPRACSVLRTSGRDRAALGEYIAGALGGASAVAELPFHARRGTRIRPVQLEGVRRRDDRNWSVWHRGGLFSAAAEERT